MLVERTPRCCGAGRAHDTAGTDRLGDRGHRSRPVKARKLLRLRSPRSNAGSDERDGALIRDGEELAVAGSRGFKTAVLLEDDPCLPEGAGFEVMVRLGTRFGHLRDGDIISLDPGSGRLRVLYRRASRHNAFLVTERCNHYCLMCSQPPRKVDDGWILDEIAECIELIDPATKTIGFTGGEPLLEWQRFIVLLAAMRDRLPETVVHVLTNGRAFAADEVTSAGAAIGHKQLMAGIPVYSAVDAVHDYVVQARGAFDETVLGILRLKDKGQRVEVRVVLQAVTAPRLRETCGWLARNLPFVDHVALMGLENTGFALADQDLLWIDPLDSGGGEAYSQMEERCLARSVRSDHCHGVAVGDCERAVPERPGAPVSLPDAGAFDGAHATTPVRRPRGSLMTQTSGDPPGMSG